MLAEEGASRSPPDSASQGGADTKFASRVSPTFLAPEELGKRVVSSGLPENTIEQDLMSAVQILTRVVAAQAQRQAFAQQMKKQRQQKRMQELEGELSKRAKPMGQFMASQGGFGPQSFHRLSRPSFPHSTTNAPLYLKGLEATNLDKKVRLRIYGQWGIKHKDK